jgi:hypothetical protein
VERTPKRQFEYLDFDVDRLEIDGPCVVRVFRHGRRARIEVCGYLREPAIKKVAISPQEGDTTETT